MSKFTIVGHASMFLANASWGLMSPVAKIVMSGGIVAPLILTDMRVFGAMVLFWVVSFFRKPERVAPRDIGYRIQSGVFYLRGGIDFSGRCVYYNDEYAFMGYDPCGFFLERAYYGQKSDGYCFGGDRCSVVDSG